MQGARLFGASSWWWPQPPQLPANLGSPYSPESSPSAEQVCLGEAECGTQSTHCLHREGGQSRSVRKRKYYYLPAAGEELKQLLESLIRVRCKTWAGFSIYRLFFSLSQQIRWFQVLGTTSAHIAESRHSTLFTVQHGAADNSLSEILCNYLEMPVLKINENSCLLRTSQQSGIKEYYNI